MLPYLAMYPSPACLPAAPLPPLDQVEEENAIRLEPLGLDRRHNRYWRFGAGAPGDANAARIWVERVDDGGWAMVTTAAQLEQLLGCLDPRGMREAQLHSALVRHQEELKAAMPGGAGGGGRPLRGCRAAAVAAAVTAAANPWLHPPHPPGSGSAAPCAPNTPAHGLPSRAHGSEGGGVKASSARH